MGLLGAEVDLPGCLVSEVKLLARCRNPAYVALSRSGDNLYVVNETLEFDGAKGGGDTHVTEGIRPRVPLAFRALCRRAGARRAI